MPTQPWLENVYEFRFDVDYTFSFYNRVANALGSDKHSSRDNQIFLGLGFTPSEYWDTDVQLELAATTRQSFNWRSAAGQIRYLWLDDVVGDPVSLVTGLRVRGVNSQSLKDISCPYPAAFNLDLNVAVGKEWSRWSFWRFHTYCLAALGFSNKGPPWTYLYFSFQGNQEDRRQWELFGRGYFGFGRKNVVNVDHFHSYALIHHQSVDAGFAYKFLFTSWGTLTFEYAHRFYAHAFPESANYFTVRYHLPFSVF